MDQVNIITLIISSVGIAIGWLLNEISRRFTNRREDRKILKTTLYSLLDLYYILTASNYQNTIGIMTKETMNQYGSKIGAPKDLEQVINNVYNEIFVNNVKPLIKEKLVKFECNFDNFLKQLSEIDPIKAYKLSGKTSVIKYLENYKNWMNDFQNNLEIQINPTVEQIGIELDSKVLNEAKKEVRDIIISISFKISIYYWILSKKTISDIDNIFNDGIADRIRDYLN